MSIFERLFRIGKANVNAAIDKIEDPVKVIDQVLRELDEDIEKVTAAVTTQMAVEKRFARELQEAEELVARRDAQARQSLQAGNEQLAREALADKQTQVTKRDSLKQSYDKAAATSAKLRQQLDDIKARVTEMKNQRSTLIAQAEAAKAQKQINQTMAGVGSNSLASTFDRMEEKIKQMHDEADAAHELANSDKSLDQKFEETFKNSKQVAVDDELAALKAELEGNK